MATQGKDELDLSTTSLDRGLVSLLIKFFVFS